MSNMNAVRMKAFGGPEVLRFEKMPIPEPGEGELLLKVKAAGVNPVDYKIRLGRYPVVKKDMLPYVPGRDVSGVVERVGPNSRAFARGDALYAMPGIDRGGYAEYVVLKEKEAARKPGSLDDVAAAAVPLAALTAWQGLFRHGGLVGGQTVLIHGGAGGVGHLAVQFARAEGAYVIVTTSEKHFEFVRAIGADKIIDYKRQRFEDEVKDVDLVFDLIGGETQDRSWRVIKKGGALVSTVAEPSKEKAAEYGVRGLRYTAREDGAELAKIATLIEMGQVKPKVSKTFSLRDAAAAMEELEAGHTEGKIVLKVAA